MKEFSQGETGKASRYDGRLWVNSLAWSFLPWVNSLTHGGPEAISVIW